MKNDKNIIFYDGQCGLCDHFVQFVLRRDRNRVFSYAALQGKTASNTLAADLIMDLKTIAVLDGAGSVLTKSRAVFYVLSKLGFPYYLACAFLAIPSSVTNWAYDLVAERRHLLFKNRERCLLPEPSQKELFLD